MKRKYTQYMPEDRRDSNTWEMKGRPTRRQHQDLRRSSKEGQRKQKKSVPRDEAGKRVSPGNYKERRHIERPLTTDRMGQGKKLSSTGTDVHYSKTMM